MRRKITQEEGVACVKKGPEAHKTFREQEWLEFLERWEIRLEKQREVPALEGIT